MNVALFQINEVDSCGVTCRIVVALCEVCIFILRYAGVVDRTSPLRTGVYIFVLFLFGSRDILGY